MQQGYRSATKRLNDLLESSQQKSYFVAAITVVFIVIMSVVGIVPAYSAFSFQSEENAKRNELILKLTNKLRISQSLTNEFQSKTDIIDYFLEILPENYTQETVVKTIEDISKKNNSFILNMNFNKSPSQEFVKMGMDGNMRAQQVNISIAGSQSALQNVVKDIEESRRVLNIIGFTLDRKADDATNLEQGDHVLSLSIEYYYYSTLASQ